MPFAAPSRTAAALLTLATLLTACGNSNNGPNTKIVVLSPTSLTFPGTPVGMTSVTQSITLTNNTTAAVAVASLAITGTNANAFLDTSNCAGASVPVNGSCTITIAYAPTLTGAETASLVITDNGPNSPQIVTLTGAGTSTGPIVSLSETALTFSVLPVGQAATQTLTLTNIGSGSLNLSGFTLTGANATSFGLSGACLTTGSLAASSTCSLTVTYAPTITGPVTAAVNISDNAANSPQQITLTAK